VPAYRTASEEETIALGARLARELPLKGVILLIGDLGAGKTTLAKGIVSGFGAAEEEEVSSPTFTLIHEYGGKLTGESACPRVYHIDLYRLEEPRELATLGLEDLFASGTPALVEWGERFPQLMPAERTEIRIRVVDEDEREIEVIQLP
jgi:tRNA threonylcarbamoyladenosine biosynthesis protein TsaE